MLASITSKVSAYDETETHPYICGEAEKIFSNEEIRLYLSTIKAGSTDEDRTDHIYGYVIKTITHFWDADDGDLDEVALYGGKRYPNAWMKAIELWNDALDFYDFGDKAMAYERLGHVAHLIQDMSLPAHAHEDLHPDELLPGGDDCYEDWMKGEGIRERWTFQDAQYAGGLITIPSGVNPLYYLMYTTNQYADYFASDDEDGDTYDRHGWMNYNGWPSKPTLKADLTDNDAGDNDDDGDLTTIASKTFVYAIRATATLYKIFTDAVAAEQDSTIPSIIPPSFRLTDETKCETYVAVELKKVVVDCDYDAEVIDPNNPETHPNSDELELATFVYADGIKEPQVCIWPRKDNGSSWAEIDAPPGGVDQIDVNMPLFAVKEKEMGDALAIVIVAVENDEKAAWLDKVFEVLSQAGPAIGSISKDPYAKGIATSMKIASAVWNVLDKIIPEYEQYGVYAKIHLKSEWEGGYLQVFERAAETDNTHSHLMVEYEIKKVLVPLRTPPIEVKLKGARASSWATHDEHGDEGEVFIKTRVLTEEAYKQSALSQLKEYGTKETGGTIPLDPDDVWRPTDETLFRTDSVGPFLYLEIGIWDKDPGSNNDLVGLYCNTFWPDEVWGVGSWQLNISYSNLGRWLTHQWSHHGWPQYVTVEFEINFMSFSDVGVDIMPGPDVLNTIPGTVAAYAVHVFNMGNREELFSLFVEGLDPSWYKWYMRIVTFTPRRAVRFVEASSNATLSPGQEWIRWLLITPPRNWTTTPGKYMFTVKATTASNISNTDTSNINVLSFLAVDVMLSPTSMILKAGQEATYTVGVKNLGNVPTTYHLSVNCTDFSEEWATFWPNTLWDMPPGSISYVSLQVHVPEAWNEASNYTFIVSATHAYFIFVVPPNGEPLMITVVTTDNATGTFGTVPLSLGEGGITLKLCEGLDYLFMENVKIRVAAQLVDAITCRPVSNGSISLVVYSPDSTVWINGSMTEIAGTGIYQWQSSKTLRDLMKGHNPTVNKGVYIVVATAIYNGHVATDIIELHIDPPTEQPAGYWEYLQLLIASAALATFASIGLAKALKAFSTRKLKPKT